MTASVAAASDRSRSLTLQAEVMDAKYANEVAVVEPMREAEYAQLEALHTRNFVTEEKAESMRQKLQEIRTFAEQQAGTKVCIEAVAEEAAVDACRLREELGEYYQSAVAHPEDKERIHMYAEGMYEHAMSSLQVVVCDRQTDVERTAVGNDKQNDQQLVVSRSHMVPRSRFGRDILPRKQGKRGTSGRRPKGGVECVALAE